MKETVPSEQAVTRIEHPLSPRVQEALGELVGVAKDGLLALSVGLGLSVLTELMEEEVTEVVGPKGRHDPERRTVRHGHEAGEVILGGRRVGIERPRVCAAADGDFFGEGGRSPAPGFGEHDPVVGGPEASEACCGNRRRRGASHGQCPGRTEYSPPARSRGSSFLMDGPEREHRVQAMLNGAEMFHYGNI